MRGVTDDLTAKSGMGLRRLLMAVASFGIIIFALLLSATFADRADIEKAAIFAIQNKVQSEVKEKYPVFENESFMKSADFLKDKFDKQGAAWQAALDAKVDVAVANIIASLCGCSTASPEKQAFITDVFKRKNAKAVAISQQLESFIKGKYETVVTGLIRDIRIFSSVNIGAFLLVFLLAFLRPKARFHLLLPAGLLLVSAILTMCFYIFGQNWFYTLILGSFWGLAYLVYMAIIFAFTLDITLNHGRITGLILNAVSSIPITPC